MGSFLRAARSLLRARLATSFDERGATAIEYGLIAGLIAVVIIGVLTTTGTSLQSLFTTVSDELQAVSGGNP